MGTISLPTLLRGEPAPILAGLQAATWPRTIGSVITIVLGAGLYGAAMGCWRAPEQALFVAIKFPLIILLTSFGNALINAMLAPLLGLNVSLKQSFLAVLMSFTIAAAILGAFSPIAAFVIYNAPPLSNDLQRTTFSYSFIQLMHVGVIAFAGIAGNARLLHLLRHLSPSKAVAGRVLFAWLAINLLLGSQLSWNLRPFIGSPGLPVQFLRPDAFKGNFFETVFSSFQRVLSD